MDEVQLTTITNTVTETHDQVMKLIVVVNSLTARLEAFEKMFTSNNVTPKRAIKVAPVHIQDDEVSVASSGSKRKTTAVSNEEKSTSKSEKKAPVAKSEEKIVNALTFFKKYVMFKNYDNLRHKYSTQDMVNKHKEGIKKPEGSEAYWVSIGNTIWKELSKDQKKDVREDFNRWKKLQQTTGEVSQLDEDVEDNDED